MILLLYNNYNYLMTSPLLHEIIFKWINYNRVVIVKGCVLIVFFDLNL